ncbi:MAG: hypothetical protein JOY67_15490 [Hyphomicrobiales bacterium]|nr:hypothetical protein [Hyphomicrobiales bacterium]
MVWVDQDGSIGNTIVNQTGLPLCFISAPASSCADIAWRSNAGFAAPIESSCAFREWLIPEFGIAPYPQAAPF